MPYKDQEQQREYQRKYKQKHYAENKQRYKDQAAARRRRFKAEIWELKSVPCADCGNSYSPWQMQFDHKENDRNGVPPISRLMNQYQKSQVLDEIKKCDIVCANCHADRTYKRQAGLM